MSLVRQLKWIAGAGGAALAISSMFRSRSDDLRGERALVTGASRGLGFLVARELGRRGCRVAICARDDGELTEAAEALRREGLAVTTVACDVADRAAVDRLVERVRAELGGIDILVNNAGSIGVAPVESVCIADFERALGVMFWGMLYTTFAILPEMRARRRGRVVNVTSVGGQVGVPHLLPYVAAKFAATGFSEGLHAELSAAGITVLTVTPGLMRTGSHLRAEFGGRQEREFTWFAIGATLPGLSMDAERAARAIVDAIERRASHLVLTLPAKLAAAVHGVFPGTTATVFGMVDRWVLPASDGERGRTAPGWAVADRMGSSMLRALTTLGRAAAQRFQHGVPAGRESHHGANEPPGDHNGGARMRDRPPAGLMASGVENPDRPPVERPPDAPSRRPPVKEPPPRPPTHPDAPVGDPPATRPGKWAGATPGGET